MKRDMDWESMINDEWNGMVAHTPLFDFTSQTKI